jgi:hypothetical protein
MKLSMFSNLKKALFVVTLIVLLSTLSFAGVTYKDGKVIFTFKAQANVVYLAGTFNNWSPTAWAMKLVDGVWTYEAELKPGTYQYKFVIDGKTWKEDPEAPAYVDDGFGGKNGIFTLTDDGTIVAPEGTTQAQTQQRGKKYILNEKRKNTIFVDADGYVIIRYYNKDAKQPYIAGSFNNWKADDTPLYFIEDGWWEAVLELQPGVYEYKFVVDGNWIPDPNAFAYTDDGFGGLNAVIEVAREGGKLVVKVPATAVKEGKQEEAKVEEKKPVATVGKVTPGLSVVDGKVVFAVKKENAQEAYLAGSFNGWNPRAQKMQLVDGYWVTTLALQPGVHKYKFVFVIGGNDVWEEDPLAPAYEPDGFGGKNGVFKLVEKEGKLAIEGVESQAGGLPVKGKYEFTYSFSTDSNKILVFTGATNKLTLTFNPNSDLTLSIAYGGASIDNALFKLTNDKLTIGFHYKNGWDFPVTGKDTGIVFSYDIAKNTKLVFGLGYENSELPLVAGVTFGGLSVYGAKGYFTNDYSILAQYSLEVPFTLLLTGMYSLDNTYYFGFDFGTEQLALGAGFDGAIINFYGSSKISSYDVLLQGELDISTPDLVLEIVAKDNLYKLGLSYTLSTQAISLLVGTFDKEKELNLKISFNDFSNILTSTTLTLSGAINF